MPHSFSNPPPQRGAPTPRALELAERISTLVEARVWTYRRFPPQQEVMRRFGTANPTVRAAAAILVRRGVLVVQPDPARGNRTTRALPPDVDGTVVPCSMLVTEVPAPPPRRTAAQRAAAEIRSRITEGTWAGDRFPTITQMGAELKFGFATLCAALKQLAADGVVHKIQLPRPDGQRGRDHVWRPVDVASQDSSEVGRRLEAQIRGGELTGPLPSVPEMAGRQRVAQAVISAEYKRLRRAGLIRHVWLPDLSRPVWHVVDERMQPWWPSAELSKGEAIARLLVRRIPEWLIKRAGGQWLRRPLPTKEELRRQYHAHIYSVEEALEVLIRHGVLERTSEVAHIYLPRVPKFEQWCPVPFPPPRPGRPGAGWLPAGAPGTWRLLRDPDDHLPAADRAPVSAGEV